MHVMLFGFALAGIFLLPTSVSANPLCSEIKRKKRMEFCRCQAEAGAHVFKAEDGQISWRHFGSRGENARMVRISTVQDCMARKGYKSAQD